ncbi:hypothetical protein ATANTOWER_027398, partial [Ataeniobius toweri]|nr:hypothetical protein [Ataeniobius toweri]
MNWARTAPLSLHLLRCLSPRAVGAIDICCPRLQRPLPRSLRPQRPLLSSFRPQQLQPSHSHPQRLQPSHPHPHATFVPYRIVLCLLINWSVPLLIPSSLLASLPALDDVVVGKVFLQGCIGWAPPSSSLRVRPAHLPHVRHPQLRFRVPRLLLVISQCPLVAARGRQKHPVTLPPVKSSTPAWVQTGLAAIQAAYFDSRCIEAALHLATNPQDSASMLQALQEEFPGVGFFDAPTSVSAGGSPTPSIQASVPVPSPSSPPASAVSEGSADNPASVSTGGQPTPSKQAPVPNLGSLAASLGPPAASPEPSAVFPDSSGFCTASLNDCGSKYSVPQPAATSSAPQPAANCP